MKMRSRVLPVLMSIWATCLFAVEGGQERTESAAQKARQAASEGMIAYKLTTSEELKELLGSPLSEKTGRDGGMEIRTLQYTDLAARFTRMWEFAAPFTLQTLTIQIQGSWLDRVVGQQGQIDIGQNRPVELRTEGDLAKFDTFWGFAEVSLANLDLRNHAATLEKMPFDSRTRWPSADKLPDGFDPGRRIEEGKNPGLGVRSLHAQGIDGRGVGIAIIDQPLLMDHQEYAKRIAHYQPIEVLLVPAQMHGPPVCSIAVGKDCGVAPKASLYYYAVPTWKWRGNKPWVDLLEKIVDFNKTLTDKPKIRVVSLSLGMFSQWPDFETWKAAVDKASENGILVVTCDPAFLRLGTLRRDPNKDMDDPNSYEIARYSHPKANLCIPAGNRTTASYHGPEVYTYEIEGGMSWAVPYLAGLAALAFQIDPEIAPAQVVELWTATATETSAGPIVSPPEFIEAVRSRIKRAP